MGCVLLAACCTGKPVPLISAGTWEVDPRDIPEELGTDAMTVTVTDTTVVINYENAEGSHEIVYDRSPLPQWPAPYDPLQPR